MSRVLVSVLSVVILALAIACGAAAPPQATPPPGQVATPTPAPQATTAPTQAPQPAGPENTLVIALTSEPRNLNPVFLDINAGNWPTFNGLMKFDTALNPVPDLAAEMPEVSEDGRTVTVSLREGVRFHDGQPLTADDVVFTWNSIIDPSVATPIQSVMALTDLIEEVEAVEPHTVRFQLAYMDPAFLEKLYVGIVPKHLLEGENLNEAQFNRRPVGTGPYVFQEWRDGERMVFTANPDYFDGPVGAVQRIVMTFVPDENARVAMLLNGTADYARLSPRAAAQLEGDPRFQLVQPPSASIYQMTLPTDNPVLSDPAVRRALAMVVNREQIVRTILTDAGGPAYGPILEGHWAYNPRATIEYDVEGARALLAQAGWAEDSNSIMTQAGQPLSFTIMYLANIVEDRDMALALRSDFARIGVNANVDGVASPGYQDRLSQDAFMHGVGLPNDPDYVLWSRYHSQFADDGDPGTNPSRMRNPAVDAALEAGRNTVDREERRQAYVEMQQSLLEDGSYLFIAQRPHIVAVSSRFTGVEPKMMGSPHAFVRGVFWNVETWGLNP
jgi:peptide/nickel transport system substrate-binding protein